MDLAEAGPWVPSEVVGVGAVVVAVFVAAAAAAAVVAVAAAAAAAAVVVVVAAAAAAAELVQLAGLPAARCSAFDPVWAQHLGFVLIPALVTARELGPACAASNTPAVLSDDSFHQLLDFDPELELVQPLCKTQP